MSGHAPPPAPLVIVEGFLCATSDVVWGDFNTHVDVGSHQIRREGQRKAWSDAGDARRRVIFAPVGPVSSIHDRACELFYALRGGVVDYGAQHAAAHGHRRFGRHHKTPLLSQWGTIGPDGKPVVQAHFVGHSLGGLTILKLYDLLSQGFFDDVLGVTTGKGNSVQSTPSPSAAILSILTISSPLRGTPLVYTLGLDPAAAVPRLQFLSPGDMLAKFVHLTTWARRLPLMGWSDLSWLPDFHADAWEFAGYSDDAHETSSSTVTRPKPRVSTIKEGFGIAALFAQLRRSIWAEGTDCAPWDCTFAQRELLEGSGGIWSSDACADADDSVAQVLAPSPRKSAPVWLRSVAATMTDFEDVSRQTNVSSSNGSAKLRPGSLLPLDVGHRYLQNFDYASFRPPGAQQAVALHRQKHIATDSGYASEAEEHCDRDARKEGRMELRRAVSATFTSQKRDTATTASFTDWRANDGVVPLASQYHPGSCQPGYCKHQDSTQEYQPASFARWCAQIARSFLPFSGARTQSQDTASITREAPLDKLHDEEMPKPGVWHVTRTSQTSHATLAPLWVGSEQQIAFWQDVGRWLARIEIAAAAMA